MTADEIAAARARLDKITPGKWTEPQTGSSVFNDDPPGKHMETICEAWERDDAIFIAHAPDDLRKALDALDRIRRLASGWDTLASDRGAFPDNPTGAHEASILGKCADEVLAAMKGSP